ncbi:hypothetical protein [Vibrio aerogenes]|uniref:hypothetical protein n=1 Tax=Vibrio aerogenes TaxID=92172 RepID=UPI0021C418A8|nr:hypothetical protein [Vibrio aerogenes]
MKRELIAAIVGGVLTSASTFGFDIIKSKYLKLDDPLSKSVIELTHISKELTLEQKSLNEKVNSVVDKSQIPDQIKVEIGDIVTRVNNIVQTTALFESKSRDVVNMASEIKNRTENLNYNENADLVLPLNKAVSICGNVNTLAVITNSLHSKTYINLNSTTYNLTVGREYKFTSPVGKSFLSYLGKTGELYKFRLVCNTHDKKA